MLAMTTLQEAGRNTTTWLVLLLLGLILLGLVIWWLFRRVKRMEVEALTGKPELPPDDRRVDDLTKIEGIGPRVEKVLKEAGIKSYQSLSAASVDRLRDVLKEAGLQMMNPEGWIEQAELAAREDWEGLKKLQDELQGGRRK